MLLEIIDTNYKNNDAQEDGGWIYFAYWIFTTKETFKIGNLYEILCIRTFFSITWKLFIFGLSWNKKKKLKEMNS